MLRVCCGNMFFPLQCNLIIDAWPCGIGSQTKYILKTRNYLLPVVPTKSFECNVLVKILNCSSLVGKHFVTNLPCCYSIVLDNEYDMFFTYYFQIFRQFLVTNLQLDN